MEYQVIVGVSSNWVSTTFRKGRNITYNEELRNDKCENHNDFIVMIKGRDGPSSMPTEKCSSDREDFRKNKGF